MTAKRYQVRRRHPFAPLNEWRYYGSAITLRNAGDLIHGAQVIDWDCFPVNRQPDYRVEDIFTGKDVTAKALAEFEDRVV